MIDKDFLRTHNFNSSQIDQITEDEYSIIRNFFNLPEVSKINSNRVLKAVKILLPTLRKIEIVDIPQYIDGLRKHVAIIEPDEALDDFEEKPLMPPGRKTESSDTDRTKQEFDRLFNEKYITQQVWILEHLVNNPNLFMKGEEAEAIKNKLKEKELEQSIHNTFLELLLESYNTTKKIDQLLNMRHFTSMKEILESRKQLLIRRNPVNFRGLVEVFGEVGFEVTQELNAGVCRILAEIIDNQKIEKILRFGVENFKEVKLATEKRKLIVKLFK